MNINTAQLRDRLEDKKEKTEPGSIQYAQLNAYIHAIGLVETVMIKEFPRKFKNITNE